MLGYDDCRLLMASIIHPIIASPEPIADFHALGDIDHQRLAAVIAEELRLATEGDYTEFSPFLLKSLIFERFYNQ